MKSNLYPSTCCIRWIAGQRRITQTNTKPPVHSCRKRRIIPNKILSCKLCTNWQRAHAAGKHPFSDTIVAGYHHSFKTQLAAKEIFLRAADGYFFLQIIEYFIPEKKGVEKEHLSPSNEKSFSVDLEKCFTLPRLVYVSNGRCSNNAARDCNLTRVRCKFLPCIVKPEEPDAVFLRNFHISIRRKVPLYRDRALLRVTNYIIALWNGNGKRTIAELQGARRLHTCTRGKLERTVLVVTSKNSWKHAHGFPFVTQCYPLALTKFSSAPLCLFALMPPFISNNKRATLPFGSFCTSPLQTLDIHRVFRKFSTANNTFPLFYSLWSFVSREMSTTFHRAWF